MSQEIVQYLQQQIRTVDERLKRFTHSIDGNKKHPQRFMFVKLNQYVNQFISKTADNRLIIIPGFRGVGKTTLMAQICSEFKGKFSNVLFLSVEDSMNLLMPASRN